MTYNDIGTPIRKSIYGEADIIYSILTAHNGRIEAIAKGIRKASSRKRGNIEFGVFSTLYFAKGRNMDIVLEAHMLDYNPELLESVGVSFLYEIMPIVHKFATDLQHSQKVFELLKELFLNYEAQYALKYLVIGKYSLLDLQNVLPDWYSCSSCKLKFANLDKLSQTSHSLICNNCARKIPYSGINIPKTITDIEKMSEKNLFLLNKLFSKQIKSL